MSKKSSKQSSRGSLKLDAAAVYSCTMEIQKAIEVKEEINCKITIEHCSAQILDLVTLKSSERKFFTRRSFNGIETLITCLKRNCTRQSVLNILAIFLLLCERKYRNKLLNKGVLDSLLESHTYLCKDDSTLLQYYKLLLKLSSKDKKFPFKARLHGLLPVTVGFLKRSLNDSNTLSVILLMVKTLASNATNAMVLGRHGCIGVFPKLLAVYGNYDYRMLENILKAFRPLLTKKSNSSKRAAATSITSLITIFDKLHHTDSTGKHISLRKSLITVLSRMIISDICMQAFQKANGLLCLYTIAQQLHIDTRMEYRSLSNLVCSVLRKALPQCHLPVNSLHSSIPFPLDTFSVKSPSTLFNIQDTESKELSTPSSDANHNHCTDSSDVSNNRHNSEPALVEIVKGFESFKLNPPSDLEDPSSSPSDYSRPASSSMSWFVDMNDLGSGKQDKQVDLSCFKMFFPELDIFKDPMCTLKPKTSSSLPTIPLYTNKEEIFVPRSAKSSPDFKSLLTTDHQSQPPLDNTASGGCIISTTSGLDSPVIMVINDYLNTALPKNEVNLESTHSSDPCALYKRLNRIEREIVFQDVARFTEQVDIINRVVYDIDDLLVFPSSCSSLSSEMIKSSDYQPTTTTGGSDDELTLLPNSEPPLESSSVPAQLPILKEVQQPKAVGPLYPESLVFNSTSESCNLRKAIQIRDHEYDLILNPDINTDHHHQWFMFEVSNMSTACKYRFNIINCEKTDGQFNYGMQPVLYSTATCTWSRVGSDILYYRNNYIYHKHMNDSSTSEGGNSSTTGNGRKKSATGKYRVKSGKSCLEKKFYTLTFTVCFPLEKDVCFIAYHYPYTVTMLKDDLLLMEKYLHLTNPSQLYYNRQELCPTLSGNSCPLITLTNLPTPSPKNDVTIDKDYVVLSSRVHPGESNSSWIMQGILQFLTGTDPIAEWLRNRFIFKIIPMLNPDGVANGSHRCSLSGHDLNRQWISPSPILHPTIFHTKGLIQWLIEHNRKPYLYCDFHGHSRKKNVFLFGCKSTSTVKELPVLLSQITPLFSLQNCTYTVDKSKESTGRVVVWRMGVERSYTMESTYCGQDTIPEEAVQVQIKDLLEMGRSFCQGLYKLATNKGNVILEDEETCRDSTITSRLRVNSLNDTECDDTNEERSNDEEFNTSEESDNDDSD